MVKKLKIFSFLLILVISVMSSTEIIFAESHETFKTKSNIVCLSGTELNGDGTQCVIICSDGTKFSDNSKTSCEVDSSNPLMTDTMFLMLGIIIAAFATAAGILLTWKDRKDAAKQRNEEIVQTYSTELREISNQELNLKTKQDCALYAEQYLDTMEKIATLKVQEVFNKETMTYFDNNFAYAMDLWWWYNRNLHGLKDEIQNKLYKISKDDSLEQAGFLKEFGKLPTKEQNFLEALWLQICIPKNGGVNQLLQRIKKLRNYFKRTASKNPEPSNEFDSDKEILSHMEDAGLKGLDLELQRILETVSKGDIQIDSKGYVDINLKYFFTLEELEKGLKDKDQKFVKIKIAEDELKKKIKIFDTFLAYRNFIAQDRWPEFRKWCTTQNITDFAFNFRGIGGKDNSEKNWRVLPDIMYYNYKKIPDEDGLTKSELVEIIRPFANDLSKFVEQEKSMTESEEFEVYAEQYLETLEQIATLYRTKIIPTKASEYFENKFSYGCNLWDWYHHVVLKFSKNLHKALWETVTEIKLEKYFSKNEIKELEKDKTEEEIKDKKFDQITYKEFIEFYSVNDEPADENLSVVDIKANIISKNKLQSEEQIAKLVETALVELAAKNLTKEDPDVWKIITLAAKSKIIKLELEYRSETSDRKKTEVKSDLRTWKGLLDKAEDHVTTLNAKVEKEKNNVQKLAEGLKKLEAELKNVQKPKANDAEAEPEQEKIDRIKDKISEQETSLQQARIDLTRALANVQRDHNFSEKDVDKLLKAFVSTFLDNERWEDFRWWCKNDEDKKVITPFQEDESEGLILPLKMWKAHYD